MKKFILFGLLLSLFSLGFSQSIQLTYDGNVLEQDETIWINGELNGLLLFHEMEIKNIGSSSVDVLVKKTEIELVPNTINYFCFNGVCVPPNIYVAPNPITLNSNEVTEDFSGDYEPGPNAGTTTIGYTFFDENNVNDSIRVLVKYKAFPLGVEDDFSNTNKMSSIYPNPTSDIAKIDYQLNNNVQQAKIVVYNLLGSVMKELYFENTSGQMNLNTTDFDEGIYFYHIIIDNQVFKTEKLVVKR